MTIEEELGLRAENEELKRQLAQVLEQLAAALQRPAELEQRIAELEQRISELEKHVGGPPPFVKANRRDVKEPKKARRKRAAEHNHGRQRETPTGTVEHSLDRCPECNYRLEGKSLDYSRQVIELPPPQAVEVIEHQVIKRYCPHCQCWRSPKLELEGQVLGQGRMGVRLASLIAYLRNSLRLPIRRIQSYLATAHQLKISSGEIVAILHQVRRASEGALKAIKGQALASRILHADETGWRENGRNGYIWSFSTPGEQGVRYYEYDSSRGQQVVKRILGESFHGHLVSDFYAGYNDYEGKHQRCWTHLLGDLHDLKKEHNTETRVVEWAQEVRKLYDETQVWLQTTRAPAREQREIKYVEMVGRVHQLGLQYARATGHPCQALAKRLLRHEDELFQFALVDGLSANNNLAERSIRPLVVIRKISGGSRSEEGTKTRMALGSLVETWQARGLNPFEECFKLLSRRILPST